MSKKYDYNVPIYGDEASVAKKVGGLISFAGFLLAWYAFVLTFNTFVQPLFYHMPKLTPVWGFGVLLFLSLVTPSTVDLNDTVTVNKSVIVPLVKVMVSLLVVLLTWTIMFFSTQF